MRQLTPQCRSVGILWRYCTLYNSSPRTTFEHIYMVLQTENKINQQPIIQGKEKCNDSINKHTRRLKFASKISAMPFHVFIELSCSPGAI